MIAGAAAGRSSAGSASSMSDLVPDRPLAMVAGDRQLAARLSLEAAEFDQRQSPPPDGFLDLDPARDAVRSPGRGSPSRACSARSSRPTAAGRARRPTAPGAARPPLATAIDRRRGAGGCRGRMRPARWSRSPGRPIRRPNGRSPMRARAARPRSRSPTRCERSHARRARRDPKRIARMMRRWHDGTGMGPVWQIDHLHRRDHPGAARGHRHRHVAAQPRLEGEAATQAKRESAGLTPQPARVSIESDLLRQRGRFPRLAEDASRNRADELLVGFWKKGERQALDRLAAGARSGALLRLDRRACANRSATRATRSASRRAARAASGAGSMSPATKR